MIVDRTTYYNLYDRIGKNTAKKSSIYVVPISVLDHHTVFKQAVDREEAFKVWVYNIENKLTFYYFNKQCKLSEILTLE